MSYTCLTVGDLETNCYVVWDEHGEAAVIDPGDESARILAYLREQKLRVTQVILTHVHFDHMLAVPTLLKATGAALLVPEADGPALCDPWYNLTGYWPVGRTIPPLTADRLLREGDTVAVGSLTLTVWHTPGHTRGSSCYRMEQTLFAGDTLFACGVGRTDLPGGDTATLRQSLRRLMTLPDDVTVLAGHGPATCIGQERRENPYL